MFDEVPYINSQASDDNPDASSPSLQSDSGGGGFTSQAASLLDKLLAYNLQKDNAKYQADLASHGATVAGGSPLLSSVTAPGMSTAKVLAIAAGLLALGVGAVWAAKRFA